jgi:hypothetical protein
MLIASGCIPRSKTEGITVTGTVSLDGAPLTAGQVVFVLPSGEERVGGIGEGGKFEIKEVPIGHVKAAVRTSYLQGQIAADQKFASKSGHKADSPTFVAVPPKYEDPKTANLELSIENGKSITINLKK